MNNAIRNALITLPLGLLLNGCATPQRTDSIAHRSDRPAERAPARQVSYTDNRESGYSTLPPPSPAANDAKHQITLEQIREHVRNQTAVFVDARPPDQFARGHVRGALNVPAGEIASYMPRIEESIGRDQLIIIYCSGPTCGSSDMVSEYFASQGYANTRVYAPGWLRLAFAKNLQ